MQCVPFFLYVNRSLLFCRLFSGWTERRAGWTAVRLLKGSGRRLWTVLARPGQPPSTNQTSTKQMSSGFFCLWKAPRNTKKGQSRSRPNAPSGKARSLIPFHCSSLNNILHIETCSCHCRYSYMDWVVNLLRVGFQAKFEKGDVENSASPASKRIKMWYWGGGRKVQIYDTWYLIILTLWVYLNLHPVDFCTDICNV